MKTKYQILVLLLVFATVACDKDSKIENVVTPITGWEDTQKVRILKVEQKQRLYTFPFNADSVFYVEYQYDESGKTIGFSTNHNFTQIESPTNVTTELHQVSLTEKMINFNFSFSTVTYFQRPISKMQFEIENNRIKNIESVHVTSIFGVGPIPFERKSELNYSSNGLLKRINSNFSGPYVQGEKNGTEINILDYIGNELITYNVQSFLSNNDDVKQAENYLVNVTYTNAEDVPDALRRMVNQAILGLTSSGTEECYVNPRLHTDLSFVDNGITIIAKNDVFSDWIISFASSNIQTLPSQNIGIVASKHIKGKRIKDGDLINADFNTIEVDSTANFPYIHDATAKTLEIAGLKIYYELVD